MNTFCKISFYLPETPGEWAVALLIGLVSFFLVVGIPLWSTTRRRSKDIDILVDEIIHASRCPSRQRWNLNETGIEFVHLICGSGNPLDAQRHLVWAEIAVTMSSSSVIICHVPNIAEHRLEDYPEELAANFRKKGWTATTRACAEQPDLSRIGTHEYDIDELLEFIREEKPRDGQ